MMPFFSGKRRARERFEMRTAERRTSRVPPRVSPSIGPARAERASRRPRVCEVCPNRSRARVCATSTPTVACRRVKARKRFAFFLAKSARGAQVGSRARSRGARSEAEPNRESRRSREARASRVEPAAREAETCRTCEYPRASASRIPRTASRVSAHVALPRATRSAPAELQFASGRKQPSPRPLLADLIPRSTPPRALDPQDVRRAMARVHARPARADGERAPVGGGGGSRGSGRERDPQPPKRVRRRQGEGREARAPGGPARSARVRRRARGVPAHINEPRASVRPDVPPAETRGGASRHGGVRRSRVGNASLDGQTQRRRRGVRSGRRPG